MGKLPAYQRRGRGSNGRVGGRPTREIDMDCLRRGGSTRNFEVDRDGSLDLTRKFEVDREKWVEVSRFFEVSCHFRVGSTRFREVTSKFRLEALRFWQVTSKIWVGSTRETRSTSIGRVGWTRETRFTSIGSGTTRKWAPPAGRLRFRHFRQAHTRQSPGNLGGTRRAMPGCVMPTGPSHELLVELFRSEPTLAAGPA